MVRAGIAHWFINVYRALPGCPLGPQKFQERNKGKHIIRGIEGNEKKNTKLRQQEVQQAVRRRVRWT